MFLNGNINTLCTRNFTEDPIRTPLTSNFFLKATIVCTPDYCRKSYEGAREYGIYHLGKATAELTPAEKTGFSLSVETTSWEGIADMQTLQERLWAGTITPTVAYGQKQQIRHPFDILFEILNSRKLNKLQRFFLALRLTKPKSVKI